MIKVLIADDEELFREGLAMDVSWEENGLQLAGLAGDGIEALEMVKELRPDIVVTDIRMPYLDGLEFISKAQEFCSEIQFIIISGHDEFEYARKAVRLGVCDFLLKPLEDGDLEKLLIERKVQILKNKKISREKNIRDSFLRMQNPSDREKAGFNCIMIIRYDDYSSIAGTPPAFYTEITGELRLHPEAAVLESRNGSVVICISTGNREQLEISVNKLVRELRMNKKLQDQYSFTIGIGTCSEGIRDLNSSYEEAGSALNQKFLAGRNNTFRYADQLDNPATLNFDTEGLDYQDLLYAIRTGDADRMEQSLERIIRTTALMGKDSFAYGLMIVGNIFTEALKILDESGGNGAELLGNPMDAYRHIASRQTMEEMFQQLRINLLTIFEYLSLKRAGGNELLYEKIKAFINRNYSNPELSLQLTSDNFNISQGHICSVFSSCSDETFKEYLTRIRINKARELIVGTDYLVYEIAHKVGYNNPTYFNSLFKKVTGFSPGQFKKIGNRPGMK